MLVIWVSGLAVSERLDKGIRKGGENKIKKIQKKQKKTNKRFRRLIKCSQGMPLKNSVEMR